MTDQQLELGFGAAKIAAGLPRQPRRITRAQWWFTQMRQIVDRAFDWKAQNEARPEQIWLPGSQRQVQI